ncbi:unnamed protein product [Boreogadus saida]
MKSHVVVFNVPPDRLHHHLHHDKPTAMSGYELAASVTSSRGRAAPTSQEAFMQQTLRGQGRHARERVSSPPGAPLPEPPSRYLLPEPSPSRYLADRLGETSRRET